MIKIDKEKFIKDIEDDLGVKKYDLQKINSENKDEIKFTNDYDFKDLGKIFKDIFDKLQNEYETGKLDIKTTCKISKEEAKNGCNKEIKIKRKVFDNGKDKLKNKKVKIDVRIPKEIREGQAILMYGEGDKNEKLKRGNLYVEIIIK